MRGRPTPYGFNICHRVAAAEKEIPEGVMHYAVAAILALFVSRPKQENAPQLLMVTK